MRALLAPAAARVGGAPPERRICAAGPGELRERTAELAPGTGLAINNISHIGEDARGELYVVDYDGELYKIVSRLPPAAEDVGFGTPGSSGWTPTFDACGLLNANNHALFRLRFAPAGSPALMCIAAGGNPTPMFGGTFVPTLPVDFVIPFVVDGSGGAAFTAPGGLGPATLYMQVLVVDVGLAFRLGFSNALRVNALP